MKNRDIGRLLELRLNTASAIVESALKREEPLGTHYIIRWRGVNYEK